MTPCESIIGATVLLSVMSSSFLLQAEIVIEVRKTSVRLVILSEPCPYQQWVGLRLYSISVALVWVGDTAAVIE